MLPHWEALISSCVLLSFFSRFLSFSLSPLPSPLSPFLPFHTLFSCLPLAFFPLSSFFSLSHCLAHCLITLRCLIHLSATPPLSITYTRTHIQCVHILWAALHECVFSPLLLSSHSFTPISISPLPLTHFYYCHSLAASSSLSLSVRLWAELYWERLAGRHRGEEGARVHDEARGEKESQSGRERERWKDWLICKTMIERGLWYTTIYTAAHTYIHIE